MKYENVRDELAMALIVRALAEIKKGDPASAALACKLCEAAESLPCPSEKVEPAPKPEAKAKAKAKPKRRIVSSRAKK